MGDGGRPQEVTDEKLLSVFIDASDPVLKTNEVAKNVSIGRRAVYERLQALETEGVIRSKKVGRSRVWWYPGHTNTGPPESK